MIPRSVTRAIREPNAQADPIPLDDYLAARREDPDIARLLPSAYLEELLEAAADRLDSLQLPTIPLPTQVHGVGQCTSAVMIEETPGVSRCLRLEHPSYVAHANGDLRWLEKPGGEIQAWWHNQPWTETTLGQLIRDQGIMLQPPHLPLEAEPDITHRFTGKSTPVIEATRKPPEDQP